MESLPEALKLADELDRFMAGESRSEAIAAELRRLHQQELAVIEWHEKTDWVQNTVQAHELGMHRADVLRERIKNLYKEIERLNYAVMYEQSRTGRIGTHGPGCHLWGHRHHECLEREYDAVVDVLKDIVQLWDHHCQAHGDGKPTPLHVQARAAIAKAEVCDGSI